MHTLASLFPGPGASASLSAIAAVPSASGAGTSLLSQIAPWLALLAGVVVAGWIVIVILRRWLRAEPESQVGFTLEDLRRMHRDGEISGEEFEQARRNMLTKRPTRDEIVAQLKPNSKPLPRRRPPA